MILGKGDLASVLKDRHDLLFFACGVSNSQETNEAEYQREIDLLLNQSRDSHLVYFSTLAIFYSKTRYTTHKRVMEEIVKKNFKSYTIIRLGNITWGNNPHTLINYLKDNPQAELKDEYRYICEKDEFLHWMSLIPTWSTEINIPGKRMKVAEIYKEYV